MGALGQEQLTTDARFTPGGPVIEGTEIAGVLNRQVAAVTSEDFVRERIIGLLPAADVSGNVQIKVLQDTGTGRLTLRYDFGPGRGLIGKVFTDALGERSYCATIALWNSGFGTGSHYQVPEIIAYDKTCNFLLMREAQGMPVATALDESSGLDLDSYVREAARWLAKLHRSSIRAGKAETDWESLKLFRLSTRFIKAAAVRPECVDMARDLLRKVNDRVLKLNPNRRMVYTHGRYHHDHVYVTPAATVVIDLDRCGLSDPGKDVGEFISVMRSSMFKRGSEMAKIDLATGAFLSEYLSQVPESADTAGCYWATAVMHDLLSGLKKRRSKGQRTWQEVETFYVDEINRALEMA